MKQHINVVPSLNQRKKETVSGTVADIAVRRTKAVQSKISERGKCATMTAEPKMLCRGLLRALCSGIAN